MTLYFNFLCRSGLQVWFLLTSTRSLSSLCRVLSSASLWILRPFSCSNLLPLCTPPFPLAMVLPVIASTEHRTFRSLAPASWSLCPSALSRSTSAFPRTSTGPPIPLVFFKICVVFDYSIKNMQKYGPALSGWRALPKLDSS